MSMADLIHGEAELDDEENDESFDEENEENGDAPKKQKPALDDSSEEEEDDDDEEAARAVREGFIIDDEDDEIDDSRARRHKRKRHEKRNREVEEAVLDDEDLDLIGEANPEWERKTTSQPKFKRLKRGHRDESEHHQRGLQDIFSDDEEAEQANDYERPFTGREHHQRLDEFADFIEEDYPDDEETRRQQQEEIEVGVTRPREKGYAGNGEASGLDSQALEDMEAIFGNGEDYDWALALEDEEEAREAGEHNLELKDVFEPSQLTEKLLTDEDNQIRWLDEPERFQLDRLAFKNLTMSDEQFKEESRWITSLIWPKKQLHGDLQGPFTRAIGKVLEFFVVDEVEVPYVFQHRKDYLIHATRSNQSRTDEPEYVVTAEKLLNQDDLWRILELDLKFRALIEKRNILQKTYDGLRRASNVRDRMVETMLPIAVTMEELQDIQDFIYFQYSAEIKDAAASNVEFKEKRRAGGKSSIFDRIRKGQSYQLVQAYGITPDQVAQNALKEGRRQYVDDASLSPIDFADSLISGSSEFSTGEAVLTAARQMYAEELYMNPRMRKHFRMHYYGAGVVNCRRTEKGLRKIDEQHPYYELKYLKNQTFGDIANKPETFLKMLKAEEEGLLEVKVVLQTEKDFRRQLLQEFTSENFSELADAWNDERKKVMDLAFTKLDRVITKGVKESMRTECQDSILKLCREEYSKKLDQAPYKPKGMILGTVPRVLALSSGNGDPQRDAVCWAWVEEDGRVLEHGKFNNLSRDEKARAEFVELVQRRNPDVLGVSGFSVETHRLVSALRDLVEDKNLRGPEFEDQETGEDRREPLEVVVVNDEVARLYKDSPRAKLDHPALPPLSRYCVALAKYLQNPMKEYAALGKDITSLQFHPSQQLLPEEKLRKQLETAMVDMVNLCGVDINEAISDSYTAMLLPYVCGLGPRKATAVLKTINQNGGIVNSRDELVGDPDSQKLPVVGPRVWNNCASFLSIEYDSSSAMSDYLDNTRVHPEDYELGRKMAADALELDEEDVKAEVDENGPGAIIRKLIKDDEQEKVNDLILEEYAEQLERNYNQRKRATLETIRAELQQPYEELRRNFEILSDDEIFTMLCGETQESLDKGMIVSVNIRVVKDDFLIAKLDCGIEGRVDIMDGSERELPLNRLFSTGQVAQAKLLEVDRRSFTAKLSLRDSVVRVPYRKRLDHEHNEWDYVQEQKDKEELREKDKSTGRTQRVVNHPLFRPFNSTQAEEYLGSQSPGDAVIRPSSKGNDHLAVTWKVADGVYQHIDVLELEKENEFSVGRKLRIGAGTKYNYSDLDELIVDHVKAMSKKVDEMTQHEKFQPLSRNETENWLRAYTQANPRRSVYAFCIDNKHPGYFYLCFMTGGSNKNVNAWPVKVVPNAFELMKAPYPDMRALCNGFKMRVASESQRRG